MRIYGVQAWRKLAVLGLLIWACANLAWASNEADREAGEFIQQFGEIRIGITKAPGNGHQAYAITVMKKLRELGFNGVFEVFYDPAVKGKLEFLIPGFNPEGSEVQKLSGLGRLTAIEWKEGWQRGQSTGLDAKVSPSGKKRVALGIMGGDDLKITPEQLNVDGLIRVQPTGWNMGTVALRGQIPDIWKDLSGAKLLPNHVKATQFKTPEEFLRNELGGSAKYRAKTPGLQSLLENMEQLEMMAAYGLSFSEGPKKLANILAGIEGARRLHPERFRGPVVIPLLSSFNEAEWAQFHGFLEHLPEVKAVVTVQGTSDSGISHTIESLKGSEILVMPVGAVTQNVWNVLVERSTLPPIISGTTGRDFAKARGRPYFNTVTIRELEMPSKVEAVKSAILAAHAGMIADITVKESRDKPLQDLSKYIAESMESSSEVSRAFAEAGNVTRQLPDKVSVSLIEAKKFFEAALKIDVAPAAREGRCLREGVAKLLGEK
ncbi:hypothetical protein WDW86_08955 [Bdellovibrionota bacterium FG-2]